MPAKKFIIPFAATGDKTAIPNTLQPDGTVSYAQGFGPDYELDKTVDPVNAKDVPRDQTNQLNFDVTDAIGEQQLYGVSLWGADRAPYPLNARAYHADKLWRSNVINNNGEPGVSGWDDVSTVVVPASKDGIAGSSSNLKSSATGTNATVTVAAGAVCLKNSSNEQIVINALALAINSAAAGANGLDTGSLTASTWYCVWAIWNGTTTAGLLSLSPTAPTMPVGYTHKALVSVIRTDATANKYPISFLQAGNAWRYKVSAGSNLTANSPLIASGVNGDPAIPTYVAVALGNFIPAIAVAGTFRGYVLAASANLSVVPSPSITTIFGATLREANGGTGGIAGSVAIADIFLESTNIYWATNDVNGRLFVDGFLLNL